ncbi:hypothetical protein [Pontibacter arcticus]|uniref:Uncharacterized protein n=1 Tax=Pontibacter arcticus TaxID=2080288 RepID=A0A364REV9_9BACT|nr:hypothetical protein [Pontibacter arcticus]RAU82785.1 hypothetical protein DP923_05905 [Pontibacter arcticus]
MWIEISKDIFESKNYKGFNYLLQILTWNPISSIARYNIVVESENIKETENYNLLSITDKQLIDEEYNHYVNSSGQTKFHITTSLGPNNYNLEEAIRFFNQPVSIILENSKNDASFITALVSHYDRKLDNGLRVIEEHINNGWIQFENAGGCSNVENFIEGKLQSFNSLSLIHGKQNFSYLRCILILDSDKEYPTQRKKSQYEKLENYLEANGIIPYHILEKRMMENYMPDEVFSELNNAVTSSWISVYLTLTKDQKDYINIKNGFPKEYDQNGNRLPIKQDILNLYNISIHNFNILDKGLNFPDFKNKFPLLFSISTQVNKYTLSRRDGSNELERILEKIRNMI